MTTPANTPEPAKAPAPADVLNGGQPPATPPVEPQVPLVEPEVTPPQEPAQQEPVFKVDTSKSAMDQLDQIVTKAGLDTQEVVQQVNDNGGVVTPAIMISLVEAHGEAVAQLVAQQMTNIHGTRLQEAKVADQAMYDHVQKAFEGITEQSGKETWHELKTWAKEFVPKEEIVEINKLLTGSTLARQLAMDTLIDRFQSSDQYEQQAVRTPANPAKQAGTVQGISAKEYNTEMNKLLAKGYAEDSREMNALAAKRNKGRQLGL